MSDRRRWTELATRNPYWAVLDYTRYRSDQLSEDALRDFFATGETEFARTLANLRRVWSPDFVPASALDYGCGVGRLVIPMSRVCRQVVGVDLSVPMLREAARNCERHGIANATFVQADEFLAGHAATFDFIHSNIVFQHIPPALGLRITDTLLQRLRPGGIGALQYTYAREASWVRRAVHPVRRWFPPLNVAVNLLQGRPPLEPMMPMHSYDLASLFALFERHDCRELHVELTDHGGHKGAMFTFMKPA